MFLLDSAFYEPTPPASFRYLRNGTAYSVRPEMRGNNQYWYMHKRNKRLYLGPIGTLNRELLNNAVEQIEDGQ